ncbi:MAG: hypothetical protein IPP46_18275 [Bacteroidetes bacterium]|nr:hypothetical protein [Bacteroidota bacterium]
MTVINNKAGIIFDWNPPVMTNTTSDTIDFVQSVFQPETMFYPINASPNPSKGHFVFRFAEDITISGILKCLQH